MCNLGTMIKTHSWKYGDFLLDRKYLFVYLFDEINFHNDSFFLSFHTRRIFDRLKNFNQTLHLRQTFQQFLSHLHGTDESGGILFTICPCAERCFGKFQLSSHASMQPRLFLFKKIKRSCCSLRASQFFFRPYWLELWPQFFNRSASTFLYVRMVP